MKITTVNQRTARFNLQRKPKNAGVYLEISLLNCLTTKKIPGLSQKFSKIAAKFQDFPRHSKTLFKFQDFPGLTRAGGNHVSYKLFEYLQGPSYIQFLVITKTICYGVQGLCQENNLGQIMFQLHFYQLQGSYRPNI